MGKNNLNINQNISLQIRSIIEELNFDNEILFDNHPQPIWIYNSETFKMIYLNSAALEFLGYELSEVENLDIREINLGKEDSKILQSDFVLSEANSENSNLCKLRKKDGTILTVGITSSCISRDDEIYKFEMLNPSYSIKGLDIIQRRYAAIVESSDDAILSKKLDGTITSWNSGAEKIYGYTFEEVINKNVQIIYPEELKNQYYDIMNKIKAGEKIKHFNTERIRKDGKKISVSVSISPIRDHSGKLIGASTITRDITERKHLELERQRREAQLLEAQQIAHLGYWEWNIINNHFSCSEELYNILGFDSKNDTITHEIFIRQIHPDDRERIKDVLNSVLVDNKSFNMDYKIIQPSGRIRLVHGEGEVIKDEKGQVKNIKGITQDVTELKRSEKRLTAQFEVTSILSEATDMTSAVIKILEVICSAVDWQIGEFWLANYNTNLLQLMGSWATPLINAEEFLETSNKCKFGPGVSLQGRVWETNQPMWSCNIIEEQFYPRSALAAQLKLHSAIAFPIQCKGVVLGVITFYKEDISEPDNELLKMLQALGSQIGQFIQRKKDEPALRESEGLYRTLVETSPDGITLTNLSGKIIFCNQKAAYLFGFENVDEIINQNIYTFIAPEDQKYAMEIENKTIELGGTRNIEYTLLRKDKLKFPAELNTSMVLDADGRPKAFIGIIRDITIRKNAESEINRKISQQTAISEFSKEIIIEQDLSKILQKAAKLVAEYLNADFSEIWKFKKEQSELILIAGYGWKPELLGNFSISSSNKIQLGYNIYIEPEVIVMDSEKENRFGIPDLFNDNDCCSGMSTTINSKAETFGVLAVQKKESHSFSQTDLQFLKSISSLLSTKLEVSVKASQ